MSNEVEHRSPRTGTTYRPRLKGEERARTARELARRYAAGASIRTVADEQGMSYGTTRKLILEAKVPLRGRGGRVRRP